MAEEHSIPSFLLASSSSPFVSALVVGSINRDMFIPVLRLPVEGETITSAGFHTASAGGKGANQATQCARILGDMNTTVGECLFCCSVGGDSDADSVLRSIESFGVRCPTNLRHRCEASVSTGVALIFNLENGENSIVVSSGANFQWPLPSHPIFSEVGSLISSLPSLGFVLLQREIPDSVNLTVSDNVNRRNASLPSSPLVSVHLDCGGSSAPVDPRLFASVTLISMNESEMERITEIKIVSRDDAIRGAQTLFSRGSRCVLVTLGGKGAVLCFSSGEVYLSDAESVERVVDTTGCGDSFRAAFAVAAAFTVKDFTAMGGDWMFCLKFASLCASMCLREVGSINKMPKREQIIEEMKRKRNLK